MKLNPQAGGDGASGGDKEAIHARPSQVSNKMQVAFEKVNHLNGL